MLSTSASYPNNLNVNNHPTTYIELNLLGIYMYADAADGCQVRYQGEVKM